MTDDPEAGVASTAIIVCVTLLLLTLGVVGFVRFDRATDQASGLQNAADSSALAAAQEIARDAPGALAGVLTDGGNLSCGLGQNAAGDFAGRNGADVVSYCYYPVSDRIEVTVRSRDVLESGKREQASAVARTGMRLGPCRLPDRPTPTPTPSPSPTSTGPSPSSTPSPTTSTPPPDSDATASCGDLQIPLTFPGDGGPVVVHWDRIDLHFEPRLQG
ncbi:pilus assembly protein TadG-related protein [Branchiibius cervicis]|uniref:Pilus assembly protein TadG-related protein n=1 Tax=Branchiibius cervicis TaxID=908252 RepID=A0ABW2AWC1_9MICO